MTVDGAHLSIQQQGTDNNLRRLMSKLEYLEQADGESAEGDGKQLIIDRFTRAGASASLSAPDLSKDREVTLPTIVVRDIGRASKGATGAQVTQQLLRPVIEKSLSCAATQSLKDKASE